MNIPSNIMDQGRVAENLIAGMAGGAVGETQGQETVTPPQTDVVNSPADPTPQPQTTEDYKAKYEDALNQYNLVNSQLVRLQSELATMKIQNYQLQKTITDFQEQAPANPPQNAEVQQTTLNPEQFEGYGSEFVTMANTINDLTQQLNEAKQQTPANPQPAQQPVSNFWQTLHDVIPNFEAINKSDAFVSWLQQPTYTGEIRHNVLVNANANEDLATVQGIFSEFVNSGLNVKPEPQPTVELPPQPQQPPVDQTFQPPQQTIEAPMQQMQPVTPTAPVQPQQPSISPAPGLDANFAPQPQGQIYTRAAVNKFFNDVTHRKFQGQEAWVEATMADIVKAGPEGRIQ